MSIYNRPKLNRLVDSVSGLPLVHGDYYRPADRIIDVQHAEGQTGDFLSETFTTPSILSGLVVTVNGGNNQTIDITAGEAVGYDPQLLTINQHNYDGSLLNGLDASTGYTHPINTASGLRSVVRFIDIESNLTAQATTNIGVGLSGYVKLRYKDQNLFTRNTPADPTGTAYSFLTRDSYELIIDTIAPTSVDVCLGNITKDAFGAITSVTSTNRNVATGLQLKNGFFDLPGGFRLKLDDSAITADRTYTLQNTDMTIASVAQVDAVIPSGSRMLFQQTAAPVGWTKETGATYNNAALRLVTGAVGTGGANSFTTAFNTANTVPVGGTGATTIGFGEMPGHDHGGGDHSHGFGGSVGSGGTRVIDVSAGGGSWFSFGTSSIQGLSFSGGISNSGAVIGAQGSWGSHSHSMSNTSLNLNVTYHDMIIATKN